MEYDDSLLRKSFAEYTDNYLRWCEKCVHSHLFLMDGIGICRLRHAYVYYCFSCENFNSNGKKEDGGVNYG